MALKFVFVPKLSKNYITFRIWTLSIKRFQLWGKRNPQYKVHSFFSNSYAQPLLLNAIMFIEQEINGRALKIIEEKAWVKGQNPEFHDQ